MSSDKCTCAGSHKSFSLICLYLVSPPPHQAVRIPLRFLSLILHYKHAEEAESLKSLMTLLIIDWLSVLHMRRIPLYSNQYHFGWKDT